MAKCWILISRTTSPATPATKKKIDKSRLNELDSSTLVELIKDYMGENQSLRRENGDLFSVRDMMLRFKIRTLSKKLNHLFSGTKSSSAGRTNAF